MQINWGVQHQPGTSHSASTAENGRNRPYVTPDSRTWLATMPGRTAPRQHLAAAAGSRGTHACRGATRNVRSSAHKKEELVFTPHATTSSIASSTTPSPQSQIASRQRIQCSSAGHNKPRSKGHSMHTCTAQLLHSHLLPEGVACPTSASPLQITPSFHKPHREPHRSDGMLHRAGGMALGQVLQEKTAAQRLARTQEGLPGLMACCRYCNAPDMHDLGGRVQHASCTAAKWVPSCFSAAPLQTATGSSICHSQVAHAV